MKAITLSLVLAALPFVLLAEPNCPALGFTDVMTPRSGSDLRQCTKSEQQCCTNAFLEAVELNITRRLKESLSDEFKEVIEVYLDDVENLLDFFEEDFTRALLKQFPGSFYVNTSRSAFTAIVNTLVEYFETDDDNDEDKDDDDNDDDEDKDGMDSHEEEGEEEEGERKRIDEVSNQMIVESLIRAYSSALQNRFHNASSNCISKAVTDNINRDAIRTMAVQLQKIRGYVATLQRIGYFLRKQRESLRNVTILRACVTRYVQLAICSRCTKDTPPLCYNTCNALLRACYSPYYTALNRHYNRLWELSRKIITESSKIVEEFFKTEISVVDISAVRTTVSDCGVRLPEIPDMPESVNSRRKRDDDRDDDHNDRDDTSDDDTSGDNSDSSRNALGGNGMTIPRALVADIMQLRGAFMYGSRGLLLCSKSLRKEFCDDRATPTNKGRYCRGDDVCTARCNCSDGERVRSNDTESFNLNDIEDQDQNPVITISRSELEEEAARIGDPVTAFLTSDEFTSVAPDDISEESSSSGVHVVASFAVILLASLLTALQ